MTHVNTAIILFLTPGFLAHIVPKNTLATIVFNNNNGNNSEHRQNEGQQHNDDNNHHQLQQLNISSNEYSKNLDDGNNLELSSSTASKKNLLAGFMINDDETNENYFDESSESTDSDFVLISDSELNNV